MYENGIWHCRGNWIIGNLPEFSTIPSDKNIIISGKELTNLDSAGALVLLNWSDSLKAQGKKVEFRDFNPQHEDLLTLVDEKRQLHASPPKQHKDGFLEALGKKTIDKYHQGEGLLTLVGDLTEKLVKTRRKHLQLPGISAHIYHTGITALPIIGLLAFLIGIVLAYQMGLQLETWGANSLISYLAGMAIFREFAPLITAVIVAGRTSSSFTAQIGIMKINEEVDALNTMGLSPTELLVVPRVIGLLIVFPLLIFWATIFGILGSMMMSRLMLDVSYMDFLTGLRDSVGLQQLRLGLYKAPAFALLVALVGCFQGFRVAANAESLGLHTTKSVVQALFLIIVADATYSILYSWMDL